METKQALIWDLDGTLLDSYDAILAGLEETYDYFGIYFDRSAVKEYILRFSVNDLIREIAAKENLDAQVLSDFRAKSLREKNASINLMPGARAILDWTQEKGISNFIYTHKGKNAFQILRDLQLEDYFTEVLTADSGFARKPNPEALLYLIKKYQLERTSTYYVGDRLLDVETAQQAGVGSINLVIQHIDGNHKIDSLLDIKKLDIF